LPLPHLGHQVLENPVVQAVDLVVPTGDLACVELVLLDERFEDVVHLSDRELAHDSELGA